MDHNNPDMELIQKVINQAWEQEVAEKRAGSLKDQHIQP